MPGSGRRKPALVQSNKTARTGTSREGGSSEYEGRLAEITGKTAVYCVIGHPVGHSLSPAMQNAALRSLGLDAVYVAFDVPPELLEDAVRGLRAAGVRGVNCTIPHKEALIPLVDEVSAEAALIGAINTLAFREGRIIGHNTDAPGFLSALRAAGCEPAGKRALVLGAGGSSRAVVVALAREGARVRLANRTPERARELAEQVNEAVGADRVEAVPWEPEELARGTRSAELLVNTTSLGMSPHIEAAPPVPAEAFHPGLFVYDLIYNPQETLLLRTARSRGAAGAHGAGMLARQGALSLEIWTGRQAPADLMESVVLAELEKRSAAEAAVR